jgi:hypothetical protein
MRRIRSLVGTIPLLEKDKANPLESLHAHCHLSGKHSPIMVRLDEWPGTLITQSMCPRLPARGNSGNSPMRHCALLEDKMPVYCAYIVGLHDRTIGVIQLDCIDDESAIKSAKRLVDDHPVEIWQTDRPVARLDALSKQTHKT